MADTILVLEDDPAMQSFLTTLLNSQQYQVLSFSAGLPALQCLVSQPAALILLDLGLSDMDGQLWLQQLRSWCDTPVIVISARHSEQDKVQALDNGANDYLTKPFRTKELLARVRAVLRNIAENSSEPVVTIDNILIDFTARVVKVDNEVLKLTATEYTLLSLLIKNDGRVLTHQYILKEVWGPSYIDQTQYLRVFIDFSHFF